MSQEHSGGSVSYYQVRVSDPTTAGRDTYTAECNDIIEALEMTPAEANVFKAIWRSAAERTLGLKKAGNNAVYDAEKMVFFSHRALVQAKRKASPQTPAKAPDPKGSLKDVLAHSHAVAPVPTGVVPSISFAPNQE